MATIATAEDVTAEHLEMAESIFDGWFADTGRVDWESFLDRLEQYTNADWGSDWGSPAIKKVKSHIRKYRSL